MRRLLLLTLVLLALPGCDAVVSVLDTLTQPTNDEVVVLTTRFDCEVNPISASGSRTASLASSDCRLSDNSFFDVFAFRIASESDVRVTMMSGDFEPYVLLYDGNRVLLEQRGADGGRSAVLDARLGEGLYAIVANSRAPEVTGSYTVSVTRP